MAWLFLIVVCVAAFLFNWKWYKYQKRADYVSAWHKRAWAGIKRRPASALLYIAGGFIFISLGIFGLDIYTLYVELSKQIKGDETTPDDYRGIAIRYFGIIAAVGAIIGYLIAIARNIIADEQNRISDRVQITESMGRAITHIGTSSGHSPNIEVRLGGLYSLQRIMQDSLKDEEVIAKIFYAYVRQNANEYDAPYDDRPREDVQAALDIIAQFNNVLRKQDKNVSYINFSHTTLTGYSIANMDFTSANLEGVTLECVDLSYKQFRYASMSSANLTYANLSFSYFIITDLSFANLSNADMIKTNLHRADLSHAILDNTDLSNANLSCAILDNVDLSTVRNLTQEQLNQADGNGRTKLPKGLTRPDSWQKKPAKKIRTTATKTKKPATKATKTQKPATKVNKTQKPATKANKTQKPATKANKTQNSTTKD